MRMFSAPGPLRGRKRSYSRHIVQKVTDHREQVDGNRKEAEWFQLRGSCQGPYPVPRPQKAEKEYCEYAYVVSCALNGPENRDGGSR